jgi:hypothetical protein
MEKASARTELSNFGDPYFRLGLERFLESISEESDKFSQEGVDTITEGFVNCLEQRLRIEDWYSTHPEIGLEQPEQPLMITGLPRTGTSAFANLLSLEPAFRCLRAWEQASPVPPPTLESEVNDPRRLRARKALDAMQAKRPDQLTKHLYEIDSTTEDVQLLRLECRAQSFTTPVFGYHRWWRDNDMRAAYANQRRVVKLLQSRRPPNRWLFKAPHYVFHLEDLIAAYPDARFVVTHRDPVKTLSSWASLLISLFPPGSRERISIADFGKHIAEHQAIGMRRMMDARAKIGEHRFLDIHYHRFVDDPLGVLAQVYDFIRLPFSSSVQQHMREWIEANRPGKYGKHVYTAEQFGIDERAVRERFAFYTDAFDVRLEKLPRH